MKILRLACLALAFVAPAVQAADSPYYVVGRVLAPILNIFSQQPKDPARALQMSVHIEALTGLPEELVGKAQADLALQAPDKLRLHWPVAGEELTLGRNGQELWVSPGAKASAALQQLDARKKLPPLDANYKLGPFRLPLPDKAFVFLPSLLEIQDAGSETVGGVVCRVIDGRVAPALAKSPELAGWSFRLWARPDFHPARLQVQHLPGWSATVVFDSVTYAPSLPPETWKPTADQAADMTKIPPGRYNQLLRHIFGRE